MAINYAGKTFNQNWEPINGMGEVQGPKDYAANAAYAAETQTQNPYTNEAGASPYDKSGLIPGNEPGSTLPRVTGPRRVSASAAAAPSDGSTNGFEPWLMNPQNSSPWLPSAPYSAPLATNAGSRFSGPRATAIPSAPSEDGPRRISQGLIDPNTPNLDFGQPSEDDALAELAKILQGVLR